jgi:deazaflavin-dependent oxidoreductase (nitroreductase family)
MQDFNRKIIDEFRANDGRVGGQFEQARLLLLHTKGAKSGQARINPLAYLELDGHRYVFASKAGMETNPDWYHNLVADPAVNVEVGTDSYGATAHPLAGDDRDRVFAEQARRAPVFAEYQSKTARVIPVIELVPAPAPAPAG